LVAEAPNARIWLTFQAKLGLAPNTIEAYGRALGDYLMFIDRHGVAADDAQRVDIAEYVRDLLHRPSPRGRKVRVLDSGAGLANATLQQRLTAVRLFYDYLVEEGLRTDNPVGRGRYTPGKGFAGARDRGLIPRYHKLPWIPGDEQWHSLLEVARQESLRNRLMLALAYDAALRREELCSLQTGDIDPSRRLLRIRAETSKSRQDRVVPYSAATSVLYAGYLHERRALSSARGPLFLSESRRTRAQPISIWTWSKVVERFARRAGVSQFSTHTLRHLCLTDLARAGWDLHEIARFAGHRSFADDAPLCPPQRARPVRQAGAGHGQHSLLASRDTGQRPGMTRHAAQATWLETGVSSAEPWRWPIDLSRYDRTATLTIDERSELERLVARFRRYGHWPHRREILPRLRMPILDVLAVTGGNWSVLSGMLSVLIFEMHERQTSFWGWGQAEWTELLCSGSHQFAKRYPVTTGCRQHLMAFAYLLNPALDLDSCGAFERLGLARKVFGKAWVDNSIRRVHEAVTGWGYSQSNARALHLAVCEALLANRSPLLEELTAGFVDELRQRAARKHLNEGLYVVSRALYGLGITDLFG
jgi:site-specific recombinase XerD